jgi:alanine racemase
MRIAASSRVMARFPSMVLEGVDPGRAVYGLPWPGDLEFQSALRPAFLSLCSRLLQVKRVTAPVAPNHAPFSSAGVERIGVIPIGRRDGLALLNCGHVLVRGSRAQLLGALALEHCRVDLTAIPEATVGDEVVIIGRQGREEITLADILAAQPHLAPTAVALEVRNSVQKSYLF